MPKKKDSIFFTDGAKVKQDSLLTQFAEHLEYDLAKDKTTVTNHDIFKGLAITIRDRLVRNWIRTQDQYKENNVKKVHYLSLEFLMGSLLGNSLINLGLYEEVNKMLESFGYDTETIMLEEPDMGLGNGGLGRLAACFMESMSTLEIPATGYGIRYEFGIFEQEIENGYQVEKPDHWLRYGTPWEIVRPELTYFIQFNGKVSSEHDAGGREHFHWVNSDNVLAVGHDIPVPGYRNKTVNTLRLWQAKATDEFNLSDFNKGNYVMAVEGKNLSETISKVLYPNDSIPSGKILRLRQQYFFVSATLQDIIRNFKLHNTDFNTFPEKNAIQLNDTHPAIAIPDMMRILMDSEDLEWSQAWDITTRTFGYTNHTIVPEALEEWPESLLDALLPRHMQIIREINRRFIEEIRAKYTTDENIISKMQIIKPNGGGDKTIRMAHLAIAGSHSVNGVAELHTEILEKYIFNDFYKMMPGKFNNKTNGISIRRFVKEANPLLAELISGTIGDEWIKDLSFIKKIEKYKDDRSFIKSWREIKKVNKIRLVDYLNSDLKIYINPDSIFDSQVKRFHEYKRQLLNVLHVITQYNRIKQNPGGTYVPTAAMTTASRFATYFHVHLVSDSTGETLNAMARAVCARFENVLPIEHIYALVRSPRQLERALTDIEAAPGVVMHTIVDDELRTALEEGCRRLDMTCIAALDPLVSALSRYLGAALSRRVGVQHTLDNDYFNRMDALNYAIGHDDGQGGQDLDQADVVLVGVSRTSKTPTCIYLAHRGVRAANVPLVPGQPIPEKLLNLKSALIVGLTVSPDRLLQIRRNRLLTLREDRASSYTDVDAVRDEIVQARRLYERQGWPVIDVTRRSVEETAAAVLNLFHGGHGQIEVLG